MTSTLHRLSVPQSSTNPLGRSTAGDVTSFGSAASSFSSVPQMHHSNPYAVNVTSQSHHENANHSASGSFQSFSDINGQRPLTAQPHQIYTAVYSSVAVYEMEVHGVAAMKRRNDSWLNATQILKVAGVEKGKRTKILEKEILTGEHEKVQGGYGKYQGTWINYQRGREFCRQYGVEDILRPLLDYDQGSDGTGSSGHIDTPTKEQAMAANRKRFYSTGIEGRINGQTAGNTFFQNISPTASNALAAMNKAARFESPMPRPGSAQRKPSNLQRRQSSQQQQQDHHHHQQQQQNMSQEFNFMSSSQQSMHSFASSDHGDVNGATESINSQPGFVPSMGNRAHDSQEPPRKKLRQSSNSHDPYLDPMLQDETPTEPNESFIQQHFALDSDQGPLSLPPLSASDDKVVEEKRLALLDLFADSSRTDFSSHTAILHLSGQDLDIPLDASANTALHWAATLGRVGLMRLLISRGANIFRGNVAGQTPLMAAVQVNNSLDHSCFNEMLEILGPLIEIRDAVGRTVLHHIAVSSGIKGRSQSSRYYLESLLEFTVRQGSSNSATNSQQESFDNKENNVSSVHSKMKPITLSRFMSDVVNVQDKGGNTALNLVARIGNHVIINQLDEIGADFSIANHTGFRPTDFGVFPRSQAAQASANRSSSQQSHGEGNTPSQIDQIREEIFATTTSILTQTHSNYTKELTKTQSVLDSQTAELREIAAERRSTTENLSRLETSAQDRAHRHRKILNLRQANASQRKKALEQEQQHSKNQDSSLNSALGNFELITPVALDSSNLSPETVKELPSTSHLQALLQAYAESNSNLTSRLAALQSRSSEIEAQYRKVVALCTGVEESRVEEVLESLVAAVESEGAPEPLEGSGAGKVRGFLRLVEGVE